jgi:hypothetical protein
VLVCTICCWRQEYNEPKLAGVGNTIHYNAFIREGEDDYYCPRCKKRSAIVKVIHDPTDAYQHQKEEDDDVDDKDKEDRGIGERCLHKCDNCGHIKLLIRRRKQRRTCKICHGGIMQLHNDNKEEEEEVSEIG